jgi:serine/threonine protein kinase
MGNCSFKNEKNDATAISVRQYNIISIIGKGGFGKVLSTEHKITRVPYAMKEMSKSRVISKRSVNSVMNERKLLAILRHPFIVNMHCAF